MSFDLNRSIANEYYIPAYQGECNIAWHARLYYSAMGRWMLASLWDSDEDDEGEGVSVQHIKNRARDILAGYLSIDTTSIQANHINDIIALAYHCYEATGHLYHKSNRVRMACPSTEQCGDTCYLRGVSSEDKSYISGLGPYRQDGTSNAKYPSHMFRLIEPPITQWWDTFIANRNWVHYDTNNNTQYLAHNRKRTEKYWTDTVNLHSWVSLLKSGEQGRERYYLYQWTEGILLVSELPDWQVHQGEYLTLATAIWLRCGKLYDIEAVARMDGAETIAYYEIMLSTMLPPAEHAWFELYSWPTDWNNAKNVFQARLMSASIYPAFKAIATNLGYQVKEK